MLNEGSQFLSSLHKLLNTNLIIIFHLIHFFGKGAVALGSSRQPPVSLCLSAEGIPQASLDGCLCDQQSSVTTKTKRTPNRRWQYMCEHIDNRGAMHRELVL